MKITKRQLRRIIREEKTRLLTEGSYLHEIMGQAATALEMRDGAKLESLASQVAELMMDASEQRAYSNALNAMAEAAYELESYEEAEDY